MRKLDYEKKEQARKINLISFLGDDAVYNQIKKEYRYKDTNIKLVSDGFYNFDTGEGGDNIRFLTDILGYNFMKAVDELLTRKCESHHKVISSIKTTSNKGCIEEPTASAEPEKIKAMYNYLERREIEPQTIKWLYDYLYVYPEEGYCNNIVFSNKPLGFYIVYGTYDKPYKKIVTRKENQYFCCTFESGRDVYLFESPIDAISFYELYHKSGYYVAMAGLKEKTVDNVELRFNPEEYTYHICVDWDKAGNEFALKYPELDRITGTVGKDWNDELMYRKNNNKI